MTRRLALAKLIQLPSQPLDLRALLALRINTALQLGLMNPHLLAAKLL